MACNVLWTERAQQDVDDVIGYIAVKLASPHAAREHLIALEDAVDRISNNPRLYAISRQLSCVVRGLRACSVRRYVLLYSYNDKDTVFVYRVFSTLQDYGSIVERGDNRHGSAL